VRVRVRVRVRVIGSLGAEGEMAKWRCHGLWA